MKIHLLFIAVLFMALTGCGSGDASSTASTLSETASSSSQATRKVPCFIGTECY